MGLFMMRGKIASLLGPYLPQLDQAKTVFYGHFLSLGAGCLFLLPIELAGFGAFKRMFYVFSMWSTILTSMYTINANYGMPAMPQGLSFSMAAIKQALAPMQPWLQKVMINSKDFSWLFFALIFLTAYPSVPPLMLLMRRSLWSVCGYASKADNNMSGNFLWKRFQPIWEAKLKPQTEQINQMSALAEIGLGFYLVVSMLFPWRQMLLTLLYWNYLTTRFKIPSSHDLHARAWSIVGQKVEPLLRMAPFLRPLIEKAKGYFQR